MSLYLKNNNFFHGIMLHHFHDNKKHLKGQGAIDKNGFYKLIKFIGKKNILNGEDFAFRFKEEKLKGEEICITFDDGLKCQYDLALPILEDLNIKAYFFIYSNIEYTPFRLLGVNILSNPKIFNFSKSDFKISLGFSFPYISHNIVTIPFEIKASESLKKLIILLLNFGTSQTCA